MRLSIPASLIGTLGSLAQVAIHAINYLRVQWQGHGDAETDNSNAFQRSGGQAGAAANNTHVQLKNPAASGKTVYVDEIIYEGNGTSQTVSVNTFDTDLTTDLGAVLNRYLGQAAGVAHVRSQNNGSILGSAIEDAVVPANTPYAFLFDPPLRLDAGKGILIVGNTQNLTVTGVFKTREY